MARIRRLRLVLTLAFLGFILCAISAQASADGQEAVRSLFYGIHDKIESENVSETKLHDEVIEILLSIMEEQPENLHSMGLTAAMEVANRLETRSILLSRISEVAYGHEFQTKDDISHASWVFSLGIIEHGRGDMTAAKMWFDSTLSFRQRGLKHQSVAAASKLLGYLEFDKKNYAAAAHKFQMARKMFAEQEVSLSDLVDIECSWAAAAILSNGDAEECLAVSQKAIDVLEADSLLQKRWSYAYLAYMNHARVLNHLGRFKDANIYTQKAANFCKKRGDENSHAFVKLKTAELRINNKEYAAVKAPLLGSIKVFKKSAHLEHQEEAHRYLELIYEEEGDYANSLSHAREGRKAALALLESSRAEELLIARRDFGVSKAESKARLAEEIAARAKLEGEKAKSNLYTLLIGFLCIAMLLAYTVQRLRSRSHRQEELEAEVALRTAELAAKTKRLEASNQELEKFAYIASHDMKTPLRNVTSFLGLIERRMPENAKPAIGEYVQLALGYARSMHTLVTDVLEFSKLNVDLSELSEHLNLRELCTDLVAKRSLDSETKDAVIEVYGSAMINAPSSFIGQVIGNLIDNGLKYNESNIKKLDIKLYDLDNYVKIIVSDNGIGIAPEYQDRIFELFKRLHTSDEYVGTGLGLASSKKIAERLGGSLTIESEVSKGSDFILTLPKVYSGKSIVLKATSEVDVKAIREKELDN